uniref:Uncharacterized protein n=1 Tax=Trichogramma kaykai TaxID=54128 RepID=A0ABD2W1V1_9HYME
MVGKLVAACIAVQYGWLYIKIFEGKKIQALKRSNGSYKGNRTMCEEIKSDMRRWNDNLGSAKKEFKFKEISKVIYTDASGSGWRAIDGEEKIWCMEHVTSS